MLVVEETEPLLGVLAAKCYGYPARSLSVVGITGTVGKTAVALMAGKLLCATGHRVAVVTTSGYDLGEGFVPFFGGAPDAAEIQRLLRDFLLAGVAVVLLELSAYMLAHGAANALDFTITLLTSFSPLHIGEGTHRTLAEYTAAKSKLFEKSAHLSIQPTKGELPVRGSILTFGEGGDVCVRVAGEGSELCVGTPLVLAYWGEEITSASPVTGDFFAENMAAAAAICLSLGVPLSGIGAALPSAAPPAVLECIYEGEGKRIFLDTAYDAEALSRTLNVLRRSTPLCLSVLLGSVGGRAKSRRAPLGEAALRLADVVYFTADDPDGESPLQIYRDMTATVKDEGRHSFCADRARAILTAVSALRKGDTLLILTKHEETQLIQGKKQHFSDREIVRCALQEI